MVRLILGIFAAVLCLSFISCAPRSCQKAYEKGFEACDAECITLQKKYLQILSGLQADLALKNQKLYSLGLLNENGELKTYQQTYEKDGEPFKAPK